MDQESGPTQESRLKFNKTTLLLAYQSLGVVYGDICTSPIYVYKSTFSGKLKFYEEDHAILGVLSLVFWTLTIIPLCKYMIFVLGANDNGEGGTFALYSLLCRHSRTGLLKSSHLDHDFVPYSDVFTKPETRTSLLIKEFFEKNYGSRVVLLLVVLLGTSMVIGDGILTPTMSVLSAVCGIQIKAKDLHENYTVAIACVILVGLFAVQHCGTHRVGFLFAPILIAWLLCISGVGIYNIFHWNPCVVKAISPYYIYNFFKKAGKSGWSSLGGIVLCVTGAEAMFADLGHFSELSIRIAFAGLVYPCLVLTYMGEAAYLSKNKNDLQNSFYKAVPDVMFWPIFVIATLATVVGSQAIISATFSIISQCRALSCFPRVKIVHTSKNIHGQIYIPEANWVLMVLCLAVVIGFRDTSAIGHAYGLAAITVMFVTTLLMFLIISTVWKRNVFQAFVFVAIFGFVELSYFSACLPKIHKGGWFPLAVSAVVLSLMFIWHYGTLKKQAFEQENKVSLESLLSLGPSLGITRVPGICLVYSHVTSGVPPMFAHFVTNFPAFHQILIFVTVQSLIVPKVPVSRRFCVSRIGPPEILLFQCIVRYGYKDRRDNYEFETQLIEKIMEFLKCKLKSKEMVGIEHSLIGAREAVTIRRENGKQKSRKNLQFQCLEANEDVNEVMKAKEAGFAYMMGNPHVISSEASSILKKVVINFVYGFLRRHSRRPATSMGIPHTALIEIGMIYRV